MKLTKKQEQEIMQVYDTWLNSYLNGDVKTYDSFLDDDYRFIGSTNNEEFLNKKDTTNFLKATADQLAGKTEIRNSIKTIEQLDGLVFITDLFDAYFLNGNDWAYYGRFRFTSTIRKNKNGWRFIYQHFSTPDAKAQEGETLGTEQISKENQELREAIKRRTVELVQKNRELEIETALEKVRAKSMAMNKSEELADLSFELVKQVQALGVPTWFCAFNIYDDDPKGSIEWGSNGKGVFPNYRTPREGIFLRYYKAGQRGESLLINEIGEKECPGHYEYLCTLPGVGEQLLKMKEAGVPFPTSQIDHVAFFKYGYILFITFKPAPEAHEIFKRFAKVFEQTYTRFLDLQKAEAQTKEAQIETALERVRSRSMAMHKSDELKEVVKVIFDQMAHLKINADHAGIVVDYEPKKDFHFWVADNQDIPARITVPYLNLPWDRQFTEAKKKAKDFFTTQLDFEEKNSFYKKLLPHIEGLTKKAQDFYLNCPGLAASTVIQKNIGLYIENFSGIPFSDEENSILMRFGKVFQQTYTRFLDLQNAEAQAREAQIEAALEKVRSRTLAMHKSEELAETALVLYEQFALLGNIPDRMSIGVFQEEAGELTLWGTDQSGSKLNQKFTGPWERSAVMIKIYKAWKAGNDSLVADLTGQKLEVWLKFIREKMKLFVDDTHIKGRRVQQAAFFSHGFLLSTTNEPIGEEIMQLLVRFAKVFSQTYTRFLDLQKAEAQAREAQIEGALERVRSKTMAMHNSEDLEHIVISLFEEVLNLGIDKSIRCGIGILENHEGMETRSVNSNSDGTVELRVGMLNMTIHPMLVGLKKAWKKGSAGYSYDYTKKDVRKYYEALNNEPEYPFNADLEKLPEREFHKSFFYSSGILFAFSETPISEESSNILARFAGVFGQTYRRFLDLQKAEAQAKEAQIEASLERIRARSLAMQSSDELVEASDVMFVELEKLAINALRIGICTINGNNGAAEIWSRSENKKEVKILGVVPKGTHPIFDNMVKAWQAKKPFFTSTRKGKEVAVYYKKLAPHLSYPLPESYNKEEAISTFFFKEGSLNVVSLQPLMKNECDIMLRFSKVFGQIYQRFLDLKKAEAQAREAQIEAALEKVRSRSLAMHKADELGEVVAVIVEKLKELGVVIDANGVVLCTYFQNSKDVLHWMASPDFSFNGSYLLPYFDHPIFNDAWNSKEAGDEYFSKAYSVEEKNSFFEYAFEHSNYKNFPDEFKQWIFQNDKHILSFAWQKNSAVLIPSHTGVLPTETDKAILIRFAKVFEQAYTRFMDLQKAEAQAREAQIEMALEKVRSRTMAMQKGEELQDVVVLLYKELIALGVTNFATCGYVEINEKTNRQATWVTSPGGDSLGLFHLPLTGDVYFDARYDAWKKQQTVFHQTVAGKKRRKHLEYAITTFNSKEAEEMVRNQFPDPTVFYCFNFSHGYLHLVAGSQLTQDEETLLARFTRVFEQTYARFLDLQKAEAQAREAKIEMALEKIRSRTMAMQHSDELPEAANLLFLEVQALGIPSWSAGYNILADDKKSCMCWMSSEGQMQSGFRLKFNDSGEPSFAEWLEVIKKEQSFLVQELGGKALEDHYNYMRTLPEVGPVLKELEDAGLSLPTYQINHLSFFNGGFLLFITYEKVPHAHDIFNRFTKVFEQTYTRFLDLKRAEAQAREATKQASLDRVRGQIASMRSTADLDRITPLVWNELTTLGVPFIRCGVFIIDEQTEIVKAYLSAPDGHSLGVLHLKFNADPLTESTITHWRKGSIFKKHWNKEEFISWTKNLMEQGQISDKISYQGAANPPESLDLHFIPFSQGMMYVGNTSLLDNEQIDLVQSLADAFAIAYARYEDFTKLEKAKESVEITLSELKTTQNQLVQSEKMASLGELTAGIAHEIQNPLNFVNNFSEVSGELIEEMNEEIEKGDMEEAKAIANDVKQNLEKILHHGKRADAIVKGMLQHSRSSTGVKEPTDINVLADEYLRLAYHGLRAKDKSFNATMKTDYDDSLEKVNVIPQDIGRVILNLITNAFYVVDEKKKQLKDGYEPTVSVSTKKGAGKIEISVNDNGNGIPDKVKEKIFQPFFTTKPTGKGTGLGLSMSYDIVNKGHGGELKVETTEGEGTTFTIALPMA